MPILSVEDFNTKISDMQEKLDDSDYVMGVCLEIMDSYGAMHKDYDDAVVNVGKLTKTTDDLRARNMELFRQIGTKVVTGSQEDEEDDEENPGFDSVVEALLKSGKIK